MFHENEIVMLFLCIGVVIFTMINKEKLKKFKEWKILFMSFLLFFTACISTVLEAFLLEDFFNYIEHLCYAGSGIMLAAWSHKALKEKSPQ